jgi:hypothetical protein
LLNLALAVLLTPVFTRGGRDPQAVDETVAADYETSS